MCSDSGLRARRPATQATLEVWRYVTNDRDFVTTLRKLADDGNNAAAMYRLGFMYASGSGVIRDDNEAVRWYRRGVTAGHCTTTVRSRSCCLTTVARQATRQEAVRLLKTAADNDNLDAM